MESSQLLKILKPDLVNEPILIEKKVPSAVLVIINLCNGEPHVILTRRSTKLKSHAGQISFPGGTYLNSDKALVQTAIRETSEEIGVKIEERDIIGTLQTVSTLSSNFVIVPYVAVVPCIESFKPNRQEIDSILNVPLLELLRSVGPDLEHKDRERLYRFEYNDNIVWGATARVLKQVHDILQKSGMI